MAGTVAAAHGGGYYGGGYYGGGYGGFWGYGSGFSIGFSWGPFWGGYGYAYPYGYAWAPPYYPYYYPYYSYPYPYYAPADGPSGYASSYSNSSYVPGDAPASRPPSSAYAAHPAQPSSAPASDGRPNVNYPAIHQASYTHPAHSVTTRAARPSSQPPANSATHSLPPLSPAAQNVIRALRAMPPDARQRQIDSGRYNNLSSQELDIVKSAAGLSSQWEQPEVASLQTNRNAASPPLHK